ncbi:MAG: Trm112 family protein [Planctomycetes bacterium]|nr:Trm112 family protein [Planctomycetota bacterium]
MDPELLDILACPESKAPLIYFEAEGFFFCPTSRLKFPIVDGIPYMLVEEAERLDEQAAEKLCEEARRRGLPNAPPWLAQGGALGSP